MSEPILAPSTESLPGNISVVSTSMLITLPPAERAFPLSLEHFQTLCDGEQGGNDARWRDICLASFVTSIVGLLSVWYSVKVFDEVKRDNDDPLISLMLLALIVLCSALGWAYLAYRCHKLKKDSSYARLTKRIREVLTSEN